VLTDDFDPLIVEAFLGQPASLPAIPALRVAFRTVFGNLSPDQKADQRDRIQLIVSVPELRASMLDQFAAAMGVLTEVLAQRSGRPRDDVAVRTLAGAVVGAAVAATFAIVEDPSADLGMLLDDAMAFLDTGLHL
jgi:hypothetical protein